MSAQRIAKMILTAVSRLTVNQCAKTAQVRLDVTATGGIINVPPVSVILRQGFASRSVITKDVSVRMTPRALIPSRASTGSVAIAEAKWVARVLRRVRVMEMRCAMAKISASVSLLRVSSIVAQAALVMQVTAAL